MDEAVEAEVIEELGMPQAIDLILELRDKLFVYAHVAARIPAMRVIAKAF